MGNCFKIFLFLSISMLCFAAITFSVEYIDPTSSPDNANYEINISNASDDMSIINSSALNGTDPLQMDVSLKQMESGYGVTAAPTVTNGVGATLITSSSARLNGEVTSTGGEIPTVRIYYGPIDGGTNPGSWESHFEGSAGVGVFYAVASGLTPAKKYYYRCYASNSAGSDWANSAATFTTLVAKPTVTNGVGATLITTSSARLNGMVTSTGGESPTVRIYYGTSDGGTNPGSWGSYVQGSADLGVFYSDISNLASGKKYYYRCYASNSGGSNWANNTATFTTLIAKPTVTNGVGATLITSSSARLNGEVTSTGGESPTVRIYYGPSDGGTNPGSWESSFEGSAGLGVFYAVASGLSPAKKYYYRCYASNSAGSNWATSTATFTTLVAKPTVTNGGGATLITTSSARLNGEVTSTGGENPTVRIYYGTSDGGTNPGSWGSYVQGSVALGPISADISNLYSGKKYYYRCYASNSAGSNWANSTATFTTTYTPVVALQAYNGQYVCAEGGGGDGVVANRDWVAGWEKFKVIDLGNGSVALQASNGQYLCAEGGGGGSVVANRNAIAAWETFTLIDQGNGGYALQAANGQYLCAEGGGGDGVVANRNAVDAWETFRILDLRRPAKVAFQAYNGQYLCAEGGGGDGVVANRDWVAGWETFNLIDRGNGNVALQAFGGQYLCAEGGGGGAVVANSNAIGAWETFVLVYKGNGNVALQVHNGKYVCAEGGGGGGVVANRDWIGGWETFKLISI